MASVIDAHLRQLAQYGPLNIKKTGIVPDGTRIILNPDNEAEVILAQEASLLAKLKATKGSLPWDKISQPERILFREHHARLKLKRLRDSSVTNYGKYGLRDIDDLRRVVRSAQGGIDCFAVIDEYPKAHHDVISLLKTGELVSYGTELWDGKLSMDRVSAGL